MPKRRTKKQKISARHRFLQGRASTEAHVKRQNNIGYEAETGKHEGGKSADLTAQAGSALPVKRDIIKSLLLASFILSLELVVYLAWNLRR